MPKQEHQITSYHGGTNNKFDARDIEENQNAHSQLAINHPGRLTLEGAALTLYDKTDLNNHTVGDVTANPSTGGFTTGYGLFSFSHDYDMEGDEIDTEFICVNDANGIDIYDPNQSTEWQDNKIVLGSRTTTVKPEYYNVDGALRVCDSNFAIAATGLLVDMSSGITKNDITITHDTGTIAAGAIIQIDQEIMYVVTSPSDTTITVIRGFANTKVATHANNAAINYANIPKYLGHIKQDRLFECAESDSINIWVDDVQTPQPPNNTRKGDTAAGTIASSAGVQSLRIYDIISGATTNYPSESEKVVLEFGEAAPTIGIDKVFAIDNDRIKIQTTNNHGLSRGQTIEIVGVKSIVSDIAGEHEIVDITSNTFSIDRPSSDQTLQNYDDNAFREDTTTFNAHTIPNTVKVTLADDETPTTGTFYVELSGQTGATSFNGIKLATAIDEDNFYFNDVNASSFSASSTTTVQQLLGVVLTPGQDTIDEDLKRKWNFAMSFTYDGPGQEVQESLLTQGYKITASTQPNGNANLVDDASLNDTTDNVEIDSAEVFSVGDVIMIGSEQMRVTAIDVTGQHALTVERAYNNTTAAAHSDDVQIFNVEELTPTATVDWTGFSTSPLCVIKTLYNHGVDEKTWNPRINGFKIYMRDVTDGDESEEWRLFSKVNFNKGTYSILASDDAELILDQPGTWSSDGAVSTITTGTAVKIKPIDTYLSENLFTEETIIDAQYKVSAVAGRKVYIGNIRQGGRTYPDRMIVSPVNKFDTFPETNYIDVEVGDGDVITALETYGDRLLQFKKNKVYIINIGGKSEVLESEYSNAGVRLPCQVCKTSDGIAWINSAGLWYFDGKEVKNLTLYLEDNAFVELTSSQTAMITYDKFTDRLIYTPKIQIGLQTSWYIWDIQLKAHQGYYKGFLFPHGDTTNYYTNMINDSDGNIVLGYVDGNASFKTELNFYKWVSTDKGHPPLGDATLWKSKDITFGSPAIRKKIHKIYVTFKADGYSGVQLTYGVDGSSTQTDTFTATSNYSANAGLGFYRNGDLSSEEWTVAELTPSSSINNVKSIQLKLSYSTLTTGTCRATGDVSTTQVVLALGASNSNDTYNGYWLYLYEGGGRYNARRITDYDGSGKYCTVAALEDRGYGNQNTAATKYQIGSVSADFEINDITIVYRQKTIK